MTKAKALTAAGKKALGAELAALVDVYRPGREWREEAAIVRETIRCVWRAATLYGRARVEREYVPWYSLAPRLTLARRVA